MNPNDPNMPPPSDPFATPDAEYGNGNGGRLDTGAPAVASAPNKVLMVVGFMAVFLLFMMYQIFMSGDDDEAPDELPERNIAQEAPPPPAPDLGATLTQPPPLPTLPPEIPEPAVQAMSPEDEGPTNELLRQRQRSSMLIVNDGGGGLLGLGGGDEESGGNDENSAFANGIYRSNTKAKKVKATHIGNLRSVVAEGKLVHAVLETAINTDLPGPIRAIVSRDTFPEAGEQPIIPKGSRLIGTYNTNIMGGQKRVFVVWTRLIRPDGVDVMINSPLVDGIGMAGVEGIVDTKFTEIFSRALLTSVVTISMALAADEINGNDTSTTTTSLTGETTTSGSAASSATVDALSRFGSVAENYLSKYINVKPTILVDQGTPVNVFVNRDLIFPSELTGARFVE